MPEAKKSRKPSSMEYRDYNYNAEQRDKILKQLPEKRNLQDDEIIAELLAVASTALSCDLVSARAKSPAARKKELKLLSRKLRDVRRELDDNLSYYALYELDLAFGDSPDNIESTFHAAREMVVSQFRLLRSLNYSLPANSFAESLPRNAGSNSGEPSLNALIANLKRARDRRTSFSDELERFAVAAERAAEQVAESGGIVPAQPNRPAQTEGKLPRGRSHNLGRKVFAFGAARVYFLTTGLRPTFAGAGLKQGTQFMRFAEAAVSPLPFEERGFRDDLREASKVEWNKYEDTF